MKSVNIIGSFPEKLIKKNSSLFLSIFFVFTVVLIISTSGCDSEGNDKAVPVKKLIESIDGETVVPRDANTLYVGPFDYKAGTGEISRMLYEKLNELLKIDGRLAVVDKDDNPDLTLLAKLTDFQVQGIDYNDVGKPQKQRMRILISLKMINNKKGKLIFYEDDIQSFREFSEVVPPVERGPEVRKIVIENMAQRIYQKIITGWYTEYLTPLEKGKR